MPLHIGKGQTTSTAIAKIIDYAENPQKTDNGRLITGYECDTVTADTEFVLARQHYIQLTGRRRGRDDVIGYHLRQAFLPGEITPEEANQIGYELAMKLTKGNNAFVVCTHIDKQHVHNHIIICSINLDGKRKFRNFWNSAWAIRRINDRLCMEHGLSVVDEPQPSKSHYGDWLGDGQKPSYQEQLRRIIDTVLEEKPKDFSEFLKQLTDYGVTVNTDRKNLRLKAPGQKKFTRCNTLRSDYTEEAIRERIEGVRVPALREKRKRPIVPRVSLLIDIDAAIRSGKGPGFERWAKVFNLKQFSQAVLYLKEHGDMSYEDLKDRTAAAVTRFNDLSAEIKDLEAQMSENAELQKQILNYVKTKEIYAEYRKSRYSKKFRAEHESEILIHQAAKEYFDSLGDRKLPTVKALRKEYADLLERKRKAYSAYKRAREEMKELYNVKSNVEHLLNISEPDNERVREKTRR